MLRHAVIDQFLDILLRSRLEKTPSAAVQQLTHLPHMVEEFLTGRTDEVVPYRLFDGKTNNRLEDI